VDRDDAPSDDERSIPQPTMAERISAQRPKRALIQLAVVDAHGRRRSGVPIVVKRATEGRHDTEETATTDAFGNATIWLSDIREAEMLTFAVAGQPETTIPADAIDAETLVSLSLPLRADAPLKGSLAEQIRPRREYSPPLARILSAEEQYVTVPNTAGCNVPVPATQASSDFLIYQLVRRPQDGAVKRADLDAIKPIDAGNESLKVPTGVRFGDRVIFRQTWRLLGQSLGDLVYSLPLAPLESVNLAIVEWSRQDAAQRVESTTATESLLHAQFRDRSVVETVATAISEYQGGFSVIGAAAGLGGPAVGAIGGGTSHTWGNRNLVGESVQQLSDAVQQASELVRSQNSTVVVQASQAERDALQTRTVSNYNQNHALTIQYYEVLRHFEVITAFEAVEPVLLVPFFSIRFDRETALRFRRILERNALDPRLSDWLGASERLGYSGNYPAPPPPPDQDDGAAGAAPAPRLIERLQIRYITGDQTTVGYVKLELGLRSGAWIWADDIFARGIGQSPVLEQNTEYVRDAPDGDATGLDGRFEVVSKDAVVHDYSDGHPKQAALGQKSVAVDKAPGAFGKHQEADYHATRSDGDVTVYATRLAEALSSKSCRLVGNSGVVAFRCGSRVAVHGKDGYDEHLLLTQVQHQVIGHSYSNSFSAVPVGRLPWRPARTTPIPRIDGVIPAIVTATAGTQSSGEDGSYNVKILSTEGDHERVVRMAQPYTGPAQGFHFPLPVNTEVVLTHEYGHPDRPIIAGAMHNMEDLSQVVEGNKSQCVVRSAANASLVFEDAVDNEWLRLTSKSGNQLSFEDSKGSELVSLTAVKDLKVAVAKSETRTVGTDKSEKIDGAVITEVGKDTTTTVKGNTTVTVEGNHQGSVSGTANVTVTKDTMLQVDAALSATVAKDLTLTCEGQGIWSATKDMVLETSAALSLSSTKKSTWEADGITVDSKGDIVIKAGQASITMKKSGEIIIKGSKVKIEGSGDVVVKGSKTAVN